MSWLRRLSRDRNNSKGESDFQGQKSMSNYRPASSYNETQTFPLKDSQFSSTHNSQDMLASYRRSAPMDQSYVSPSHLPNASSDATMHTAPLNNMAQIPDPLTRAFNEAIKPYLEQIELLKNDLEDAHQQIQQYESERADMHAWIDKRGLRPGKMSSIVHFELLLIKSCRLDSSSCGDHVLFPNRCQHLLIPARAQDDHVEL